MAGLGIFSAIAGAAGGMLGTASETAKSNKRISGLNRLRYDDKADYEKDYYENPLERMAMQASLRRTMDAFRQANAAAAGVNTVGGASEESRFNQMQASANALGNQASDVAVAFDEEKRRLKQQHKERDAKRQEALIEEQANKPTGLDMAANMIGGVAGGISKHYG